MSLLLCYVTFPDPETAHKIGNQIIEKRLAACMNTTEIRSCYFWQGKIDHGQETQALFKTLVHLRNAFIHELTRMHPYEVPCIITWQADANPAYTEWVRSVVQEAEG